MEQTLSFKRGPHPDGEMRDLLAVLMKIAEDNQIVWTASLDGELVPPPDAHVLDHLVRAEFSGAGPSDMEAEFTLHLQAGTVAVVAELPECDLCRLHGLRNAEARYDGSTSPDGTGSWGFMCPDCYRRHSTGHLGIGLGQYLMRLTEIPPTVNEAVVRARAYWKRRMAASNA
jgi:hypothetical protein